MASLELFRHLLEYLLKGEFAPGVGRTERVKLKRRASNFILKDSRLFYTGPSRQYMRLVVLSEEEKQSVLKECHIDTGTGKHRGLRSTRNRVTAGYYWSTLIQDVKDWVRCCHLCRLNAPVKTAAPVLQSIKVREAWEVLGLDLIGPLPETARNNRYVLTLTDVYTKWVIAEPLQSGTATEVSAIITSKLYMFGMVRKITTDQEKEFINELNASLFNMLKIKPVVFSASHPQTNGQDETTKQTTKQAVRKHVNDNHHDWDLHLPAALYGINTAKQNLTRYSPYFLLFHRHPHLPEVLNACPMGDDFEVADAEEDIDIKVNEMKCLNLMVCTEEKTQEMYVNKSAILNHLDTHVTEKLLRLQPRAKLHPLGVKADLLKVQPHPSAKYSKHITIYQSAEADPPPRPCHDEANLFQCPFCSREVYEPKEYHQTVSHILNHKLNSVQHRDYIIYPCRLGCDGKATHFHCCYCSQTLVNKSAILKHLDGHSTEPLVGPRPDPQPQPVGAEQGVGNAVISQSSAHQDHPYALSPSLDSLKERLARAEAQVEKLEQQLQRSKHRQRRSKSALKWLLCELKKWNLITKDLRKKLEVYSGLTETETLPTGELQDFLQCPPDRHPLLGLPYGSLASAPVWSLTYARTPPSTSVQLCLFKHIV